MNSSKAIFLDVPLRMTPERLETFSSQLRKARENDRIRVIILEGRHQHNGRAVFSMGLDLDKVLSRRDGSLARIQDLIETLYAFPKPVVSAVQGDVIAGGLIFVALSDYVIVTPDVHFRLPEASFGVAPYLVMTSLTERISKQAARHLCMSTERISANTALNARLIDEVLAAREMEIRLKELINGYSTAQPKAVKNIKRFYRRDGAQIEMLRESCELLDQQLNDEEIRCGLQHYLDALSILEADHA